VTDSAPQAYRLVLVSKQLKLKNTIALEDLNKAMSSHMTVDEAHEDGN
jgi:hypothetical protein